MCDCGNCDVWFIWFLVSSVFAVLLFGFTIFAFKVAESESASHSFWKGVASKRGEECIGAFQRGRDSGLNNGKIEGYRAGYDEGRKDGHKEGYAEGYDAGLEDDDPSALDEDEDFDDDSDSVSSYYESDSDSEYDDDDDETLDEPAEPYRKFDI